MTMNTREIDSESIEHHEETVLTVALDKLAGTCLSGAEDGSVSLWSAADNALIHTWTCGSGVYPVNCVAYNPRDNRKLYVAAHDTVYTYDTRQMAEQFDCYRYHEEEINQVAVDEKGQYLLSCDDNGLVCCIDITKHGGKCVSRIEVHDNICASVQWVPGRNAEVVSGGMDSKIHHRDVYKRRAIRTFQEAAEQQGIHIINPPFVNSLSTHWQSRYLVAALGSGKVNVWRLGSRKVGYHFFKTLTPHVAGAGCACLADPNTVVSGGNDGFVNITELETDLLDGHTNGDGDDKSDRDDPGTIKLLHGKKINWLCGMRESAEFRVYVCDESSVVTKYFFR